MKKKDADTASGVDAIVTPSLFLDRLTDFLGDSEGMTTEEVRQELIDEGVDIDGFTEKAKVMIKKQLSLSPVMREVIRFAKEHGGKIRRYPGGFWANPEKYEHPTFGTKTVEALVTRGFMVYSEWKEGRRGKFPIEATITDIDILRQNHKAEEKKMNRGQKQLIAMSRVLWVTENGTANNGLYSASFGKTRKEAINMLVGGGTYRQCGDVLRRIA